MLDEWMNTLIDTFSADPALSDIDFSRAFLSEKRPSPLRRPLAVFGEGEIHLSPVASGCGLTEDTLKSLEFPLEMAVYVPAKMGGASCGQIFSRICEALMSYGDGLCLRSVSCGKPEFDRSAGAFLVSGSAGIVLYQKQEEGDG